MCEKDLYFNSVCNKFKMRTAVEILHAASNIPERKLNSGHLQFVQHVAYVQQSS
jgi:hypothetical protein